MSQRLLFGDFLKISDTIPNDSVRLFIIDPPYLIDYKDWDKQHETFLIEWINICINKLAPTGSMWIFMAKDNLFTHNECKTGLVNILQIYGTVHLENWVTWSRQKGRGSSKHLKSQREELIHFTKHPTNYTWNNLKVIREVIAPYVKDGRARGWFLNEKGQRVRWTGLGNSWVFSQPQWNGKLDKQRHTAQKPFLLYERLLLLSSNPGDSVVDPFAGSFTLAHVCKYHHRNYVGFENNEKIFHENNTYFYDHYNDVIKAYEEEKRSFINSNPQEV